MKRFQAAVVTLMLGLPAVPASTGGGSQSDSELDAGRGSFAVLLCQGAGLVREGRNRFEHRGRQGLGRLGAKVGSGAAPFGIADLATMLVAKARAPTMSR